MTQVTQDLRNAYIFSTLTDEELDVLADQVERESYTAGTMIFRHNDVGDAMYIVQSGAVDLFVKDRTGAEVSLLQVEAGQVFGELSLLDSRPRSASARVLDDAQLLVIRRSALVTVCMSQPLVPLRMLEILAARVRSSSALVQERIIPNANEVIEVKLSFGDRISDFFTGISGNIIFVAISLVWFVVWIGWNLKIVPGLEVFDPFPFGLLTMVVSLEMVFLSLFILIKQSRMAAHDKVRNDIEYEVNVRSELGVRHLSESIEIFEERMQRRFDALEKRLNATSTDRQDALYQAHVSDNGKSH
jgi:CRP/FNR family cyclic AMP-dependent transcriptional regulator